MIASQPAQKDQRLAGLAGLLEEEASSVHEDFGHGLEFPFADPGVRGWVVGRLHFCVRSKDRSLRILDRSGRLDSEGPWFMIEKQSTPPSSSGLGYLVLSQGTGVRVPVGVLSQK